jgi:hypothetical protein
VDGNYTITHPLNVGTGATLSLGGTWTNNTTISVNGGTFNLGGSSPNFGAISVANAQLNVKGNFTTAQIESIATPPTNVDILSGATVDNRNDTINFDADDSNWRLMGGRILGGTIASSTPLLGRGHLDQVAFDTDLVVTAGFGLALTNALAVNPHTISVTSSFLNLNGAPELLGGNVQIILNGNPFVPATLVHGSGTLGPGTTVRTGVLNGTIGNGTATLINRGLISAQTPGSTLTVASTSLTNQGTLEAINGGILKVQNLIGNLGAINLAGGNLDLNGSYVLDTPISINPGSTLTLRGGWTNSGGITVNGGTLTLGSMPASLGTITPLASAGLGVAGTFSVTQLQRVPYTAFNRLLLSGGTITGGTLQGAAPAQFIADSGTLSGVTLNMDAIIRGSLSFSGLTVAKTLRLESDTATPVLQAGLANFSETISGPGPIIFAGTRPGAIAPPGAGALTIAPNLTVRTGTLGGSFGLVRGSGTLSNQGTISSETPGQSITFIIGTFNSGTIRAQNGGGINNDQAINNSGTITIGAGSVFNGRGTLYSTGSIGGAGAFHNNAPSTIAGPQNWLAGASIVAEGNTLALNTNAGKPAAASPAGGAPIAAVANLRLSVTGSGARINLGSDQDLDALDVLVANAGNQSFDLASPATAGAARKIRIYANDLTAARASIYSALVNANAPGSTTPLDGIFDSNLASHPNSRIGLAQVTDAHRDPHLLLRPTRIGDVNLDGSVTIADFLILAGNIGGSDVYWGQGDLNYDRAVTIADFLALSANFNTTYAGESFPIAAADAATLSAFAMAQPGSPEAAVPEPTLILPALALASLCTRRRRSKTTFS